MFENFTRILGISLELQAFAIIGDIKNYYTWIRSRRGQRILKEGGGARFRILLCPTQRGPNGQNYAGIGSRAGVQWEIFQGGTSKAQRADRYAPEHFLIPP